MHKLLQYPVEYKKGDDWDAPCTPNSKLFPSSESCNEPPKVPSPNKLPLILDPSCTQLLF